MVTLIKIQLEQGSYFGHYSSLANQYNCYQAADQTINQAIELASKKWLPRLYYLQAQNKERLAFCAVQSGSSKKALRLLLTAILSSTSAMRFTLADADQKKTLKHIYCCIQKINEISHEMSDKENLDLRGLMHKMQTATLAYPEQPLDKLVEYIKEAIALVVPMSSQSKFWQKNTTVLQPLPSYDSNDSLVRLETFCKNG